MEILIVALIIGFAFYVIKNGRNSDPTINLDSVKLISGKLLSSSKYNLKGTPNNFALIDGQYVPVLVKGNESKLGLAIRIELLALCLLMEEEGQKPAFGIITTKDRTKGIKINYTVDEKIKIENLLDEVRNYNQEYRNKLPEERINMSKLKCMHCFRRQECERLY